MGFPGAAETVGVVGVDKKEGLVMVNGHLDLVAHSGCLPKIIRHRLHAGLDPGLVYSELDFWLSILCEVPW